MRHVIFSFVVLALIGGTLSGWGHALGYAGKNPGQITCKGKGTISGQGSVMAGAGLGGGGMNTFSVTGDCGDGFSFSQGPLADSPAKP